MRTAEAAFSVDRETAMHGGFGSGFLQGSEGFCWGRGLAVSLPRQETISFLVGQWL